jgi:hypothetical protein
METDSERHHSTNSRMYNGIDCELHVKLCTYSFEETYQKSKECNNANATCCDDDDDDDDKYLCVCVCVRERECVCV